MNVFCVRKAAALAGWPGVRAVLAALRAPDRALAGSALPPLSPVDGALGSRLRVLDHGPRSDHERPALDQARGDDVPAPREDAGVGLPRHPHPLRGRILVQPFHVGQTDGFQLIQADRHRPDPACRAPDRPETAARRFRAHATRHDGAGHVVTSICSPLWAVNNSRAPAARLAQPPGPAAIGASAGRAQPGKCGRFARRISRHGDATGRRSPADNRGNPRQPGPPLGGWPTSKAVLSGGDRGDLTRPNCGHMLVYSRAPRRRTKQNAGR